MVDSGLELRTLLAKAVRQEFDFHEGEEAFRRIQPEDINIVALRISNPEYR